MAGTLKTLMNAGSNLDFSDQNPPYETLESKKNYEIRVYKKNRFIRATNKDLPNENKDEKLDGKKDGTRNDTITAVIWRLIKYTQGHNDKQANMKFHFPVFVRVDLLGETKEDDGKEEENGSVENQTIILATLPKDYQLEEAPKPIEKDIEICELDEFKCYVRRFGGFAAEKDYKTETKKLGDFLKADGLIWNKKTVICLQYDAPYKLFGRRNEVILLAN